MELDRECDVELFFLLSGFFWFWLLRGEVLELFIIYKAVRGSYTRAIPKTKKPLLFTPIDRYHPIPSPCIPTFGPPLRSIQLSPPYPPQSPSRCPRRTRCRAPRAPVYWSCRARAGSVSWRPRGRPRWCRGGCPRRWCRLRNYTGGVLCAWLV